MPVTYGSKAYAYRARKAAADVPATRSSQADEVDHPAEDRSMSRRNTVRRSAATRPPNEKEAEEEERLTTVTGRLKRRRQSSPDNLARAKVPQTHHKEAVIPLERCRRGDKIDEAFEDSSEPPLAVGKVASLTSAVDPFSFLSAVNTSDKPTSRSRLTSERHKASAVDAVPVQAATTAPPDRSSPSTIGDEPYAAPLSLTTRLTAADSGAKWSVPAQEDVVEPPPRSRRKAGGGKGQGKSAGRRRRRGRGQAAGADVRDESEVEEGEGPGEKAEQTGCFEVVVYGDACATVTASLSRSECAKLSPPFPGEPPTVVPLHPLSIYRATPSIASFPRHSSSLTAYCFPLPDPDDSSSVEKVEVRVNGRRRIAGPTGTGENVILEDSAREKGQTEARKARWVLEVQERLKMCRWVVR
ncbi:hypothetical protein JCM5296_005990 [Sporobolomyces johnsonii]